MGKRKAAHRNCGAGEEPGVSVISRLLTTQEVDVHSQDAQVVEKRQRGRKEEGAIKDEGRGAFGPKPFL